MFAYWVKLRTEYSKQQTRKNPVFFENFAKSVEQRKDDIFALHKISCEKI